MEEQLISFETAKLALEKKFDIKVKGSYRGVYGELEDSEDGDSYPFLGVWELWKDFNWTPGMSGESYPAPTQSLLQKWLRDIHKIRVYPVNKISGEFGFEIYVPNIENPAGKPFDRLSYYTLGFSTYEEALEQTLKEALKLID